MAYRGCATHSDALGIGHAVHRGRPQSAEESLQSPAHFRQRFGKSILDCRRGSARRQRTMIRRPDLDQALAIARAEPVPSGIPQMHFDSRQSRRKAAQNPRDFALHVGHNLGIHRDVPVAVHLNPHVISHLPRADRAGLLRSHFGDSAIPDWIQFLGHLPVGRDKGGIEPARSAGKRIPRTYHLGLNDDGEGGTPLPHLERGRIAD